LLVEDELQYAKTVKLRLESIGYSVTIAGDAYSGTQAIIKGQPDLIILDLNMPAGSGFSILERIQQIPSKTTIPVIVLTARQVDDALKQRIMAYGVSGIFNKLIDNDKFILIIQSLVPLQN
jgi:CheY-like chemotaxis protein